MKTTNYTPRDPASVFLTWITIICGSIALACVSVIAPLAFCWIMGTLGIVGTLVVTIGSFCALCSGGGFLSFLIAGDIVRGGFEVVGAILGGLASLNE